MQQELAAARAATAVSEQLLQVPILAVLGQLNAGKSSLVASFLDPANRARLPRGAGAATGTHRFVYWLPQSWLDDPQQFAALEHLLAAAHGPGLERLEADPARAAAQYAAGRDDPQRLRLPLIAGDPRLNQLRCALLDCPDIQTLDDATQHPTNSPDTLATSHEAAADLASPFDRNLRLDFLAQAARICSALIVVWRREALRDRLLEQLLATLRQRLPQAQLTLAVNFVRPAPDEPAATWAEPDLIRLAQAHTIPPAQQYLAFDREIEARADRPGWRELTPDFPQGSTIETAANPEPADPHPAPEFFRAPGQSVADLLRQLPQQLDLAELQRRHLADLQADLQQLQTRAEATAQNWASAENQRTHAAHSGLLELCREQLVDRDNRPLQVPSPQFAAALAQAMTSTAPPLLRGLLKLARPFEKAVEGLKSGLGTLRQTLLARRQPAAALGEALEQRLRVGSLKLASAEELARSMQARRWCPSDLPLEALRDAWNQILQDLYDHPVDQIDQPALEQLSRQLWQDLPLAKKLGVGARALLGTLGSIAALGGVLVALADGGALYLGATAISTALHGGLAAAIAAAGSVGVGLAFANGLLETNTLPWLSRLFALACDHFGLPRQLPGQGAPEVSFRLDQNSNRSETRRLPADSLPQRPATCPLGQPRYFDLTST